VEYHSNGVQITGHHRNGVPQRKFTGAEPYPYVGSAECISRICPLVGISAPARRRAEIPRKLSKNKQSPPDESGGL